MRGIVGHIWLPEFYSSVEMKINEAISNDAILVVVKGHKILDISPRGKGGRGKARDEPCDKLALRVLGLTR